jgi:surfeit locus 1 family protein
MRRWLTPRALGLGVVALALMAVMGGLGWWQLTTYRAQLTAAKSAVLHQRPVPLDRVLGRDAPFPASGVGQPVRATGRYDPTDQFYVRNMAGTAAPYGVVTPPTTASGSMILVVRGGSPAPRAEAPAGLVSIQGILEPSQASGGPLNEHRVTHGIQIAAVLNSMNRDLYAGYIVLTRSAPAETLTPVRPPVPQSSSWAGIRNLIYAVQWWIFAGFVGFMWWRVISEDTQTSPAEVVGYGRSP